MNYRKERFVISKQLYLLLIWFGKLLMNIRNNKGPKMKSCGTVGRRSTHNQHWPSKTIFVFYYEGSHVKY